ncbi:MAG: hypothetical protein ACHQ4G_04635 [Opitutales bacterium]
MRVLRFLLAAAITAALLFAGLVTLAGMALVGLAVMVGRQFRRGPASQGPTAPAAPDVIDVVATEADERP